MQQLIIRDRHRAQESERLFTNTSSSVQHPYPLTMLQVRVGFGDPTLQPSSSTLPLRAKKPQHHLLAAQETRKKKRKPD
jgi:hypothetical protein